jgi:hypothetical protein
MLAVAFPSVERVDYHGMYQQSPVLPMDGLFLFFNRVYCTRGTVPKLHITTTGRYGGVSLRQALSKPDQNYKSHVSPHFLPLSGGSSRGQVIPTCFERAPNKT